MVQSLILLWGVKQAVDICTDRGGGLVNPFMRMKGAMNVKWQNNLMHTLIIILITKYKTVTMLPSGKIRKCLSDHFCKCVYTSAQRMLGHISPVWRGTLADTCRPALTRWRPGCAAWRMLERSSSSSPALTVITADLSVSKSWGKKNYTRTPSVTLIL